MSFNPDVSKLRLYSQENKLGKSVHPDLVFNNTPVLFYNTPVL